MKEIGEYLLGEIIPLEDLEISLYPQEIIEVVILIDIDLEAHLEDLFIQEIEVQIDTDTSLHQEIMIDFMMILEMIEEEKDLLQ